MFLVVVLTLHFLELKKINNFELFKILLNETSSNILILLLIIKTLLINFIFIFILNLCFYIEFLN